MQRFIDLPNASTPLEGIVVVPGFLQSLGMNPDEVLQRVLSVPVHDAKQPLDRSEPLRLIPGNHPALRYRGNNLRRHKIWLQSTHEPDSLVRYHYTGWTWSIADATRPVSILPVVDELQQKLGYLEHNHWIVTLYRDEKDNIGQHSDKAKSIDPNSVIMVIKLGAPRLFRIETKDKQVAYEQRLSAGTAVFMSMEANLTYTHGVPSEKSEIGLSASIVGRKIIDIIPWNVVKQKQANAQRQAAKRKERKQETLTKKPLHSSQTPPLDASYCL